MDFLTETSWKRKLTDVEISVKYGTVFIVIFGQYYQLLVKMNWTTSIALSFLNLLVWQSKGELATLDLKIVHMVTKYRKGKKWFWTEDISSMYKVLELEVNALLHRPRRPQKRGIRKVGFHWIQLWRFKWGFLTLKVTLQYLEYHFRA